MVYAAEGPGAPLRRRLFCGSAGPVGARALCAAPRCQPDRHCRATSRGQGGTHSPSAELSEHLEAGRSTAGAVRGVTDGSKMLNNHLPRYPALSATARHRYRRRPERPRIDDESSVIIGQANPMVPPVASSRAARSADDDLPQVLADTVTNVLGKPRARGWIHLCSAASAIEEAR